MMQPAYILTGEALHRAHTLSTIHIAAHFGGTAWQLLALLILIALRVPVKLENLAAKVSANRWLQGLIFIPLLVLVFALIQLPEMLLLHLVHRHFGLSLEGWGMWMLDLVKAFVVGCVIAYLIGMLLKVLVDWSPRRWWFFFWVLLLPIIVFMLFVQPMVLEPIFETFEPLAPGHAALVSRLEQVTARGAMHIPPERMKLMRASLKTTEMNAYVSGIGSSKQVVVWDTTLAKATDDQVLFIFGHEMGHYVLHHIPKMTALICLVLLLSLWLTHLLAAWGVRRYGARWGIVRLGPWSSLVVLALAFSVVSFFSEPVVSTISRHFEHEADVYGLNAVRGIVADPQEAARSSFQVLGETSLVDPQPNALVEFWTGSHPSIPDRAAFARDYKFTK